VCRNRTCERPVRLRWVPSISGYHTEYDIHHVGVTSGASPGRARIIYTDYRSALVYQCLQILADGACLPSQVSVEVWSRRPTMPEIRYSGRLHWQMYISKSSRMYVGCAVMWRAAYMYARHLSAVGLIIYLILYSRILTYLLTYLLT